MVVCTTRDDPVDRALSRRLGAADLIAKPINIDQLNACLDRVASTGAQGAKPHRRLGIARCTYRNSVKGQSIPHDVVPTGLVPNDSVPGDVVPGDVIPDVVVPGWRGPDQGLPCLCGPIDAQ